MMLRHGSCFLLLIITLGISHGQREGVRFSKQDGFAFPGEVERPAKFPIQPNQLQPNQIQPPQPAQTPRSRQLNPEPTMDSSESSESAEDYNQCIDRCPVTSEYNPVCGSDNVVYNNPGRLGCAKNCGLPVEIVNYGRCSSSGRG